MGRKNIKTRRRDEKNSSRISRTLNQQTSLSRTPTNSQVLHLQRKYGNSILQRMYESGALQAKLKIGKPGDRYEREADSVADRVMSMSEPEVSRQDDKEEEIRSKPLADQITPFVQRQPEEEEPVQTKLLQRQPEDEEEVQKQPEEEEETAQAQFLRRQEEEEEVQKQLEEEEEPAQAKMLQPQAEEEETAQPKMLQRQAEEEEEPVQIKPLQRQQEEEEEEEVQKQTEEEEEPVQAKFLQRQEEEEEPVQAKVSRESSPKMSPSVESGINSIRGRGNPLPQSTRSFFEPRFGTDFSGVRVHNDSNAAHLARNINAKAFTIGKEVVFGSGQYSPESSSGKQLLAHELTHVVQQGAIKNLSCNHHIRRRNKSLIQRTKANLYVYDSTQGGWLGWAWRKGAWLWAKKAAGGYAIPSGSKIVTMLARMLKTFRRSGCSCIEEIQFWCHGESGVSMNISQKERFTAADFNVKGLRNFQNTPSIWTLIRRHGFARAIQIYRAWLSRYNTWKAGLTLRPRLLVELRERICSKGAEVYYRSCETFQGKKGKIFARKAADFWKAKVIGNTHVIGLSQPGKKKLKPGQKPYWSDTEGKGKGYKHWLKTLLKGKGLKKLFKKYVPF